MGLFDRYRPKDPPAEPEIKLPTAEDIAEATRDAKVLANQTAWSSWLRHAYCKKKNGDAFEAVLKDCIANNSSSGTWSAKKLALTPSSLKQLIYASRAWVVLYTKDDAIRDKAIAARFRLSGDTITMTFVADQGSLLDSFTANVDENTRGGIEFRENPDPEVTYAAQKEAADKDAQMQSDLAREKAEFESFLAARQSGKAYLYNGRHSVETQEWFRNKAAQCPGCICRANEYTIKAIIMDDKKL